MVIQRVGVDTPALGVDVHEIWTIPALLCGECGRDKCERRDERKWSIGRGPPGGCENRPDERGRA
jgi:hypothetical protein